MTVPLDLVNEPKQIPTKQTRPSLLCLEREAEKLRTVTASSVQELEAWKVSCVGFELGCLIEYVRQLEAKLVEQGVERNEDFQ